MATSPTDTPYAFSSSGEGMNFVAPLEASARPVDALRKRWSKTPFCFNGQWVDTSELGLTVDELDVFFRKLPKERLFVRQPGGEPGSPAPRIELGPQPLAEQLAARNLHIVALDLEKTEPAYARAMEAFLEIVFPFTGAAHPDELEVSCGLFMASGRTVVPFHADFEHNFLIHVLGEKQMHIFPREDTDIFGPKLREKMAADMTASRFIPYDPSYEANGHVIALNPGTATYQPPMSPHWVVSSEGVTLSLLFAVFTPAERDLRMLHLANGMLRKCGLSPYSKAVNTPADRAKVWMASRARDMARAMRARNVRRGMVSKS